MKVRELYSGCRHWRKVAPSVPHDLGDPAEEPWVKVGLVHWRSEIKSEN